ncbi:DNA-binding NarL/FixJ family response regulator [Streptosporangium becharense]|uniref:DNA-binding NarL/FixJ family response regulator n=1 Tax=Streptosporangium becharense TaxID=1816182 RepID=A0A7W9IKF5_9ACTN|nr:response regulator transcription factor [Streptosporangium becharense]MBB2911789.1 DNA-binding NarL/FixJ family response regulator [Streptosporangium becharense]MBB5822393.1 DNA-binding NarL/FixJ family response regulator [Streptosporangium becharense]
MSIRVLVVDDHPLFRHGLRALLEQVGGTQVVGEAGTGDEAVSLALSLDPDVVLMDLVMPGTSGIEATRQLIDRRPELGVLVLTMSEDDGSVFAALRAGARGYVLKGTGGGDLIAAVQAVARGEAVYGPAVARRIRRFLTGTTQATPFPELTPREREVLDLLASGRTNAEIARTLFISHKTVKNHLTSVFAKLQVADRAQAMLRARRAGLGD